jgi:hypothetical protein
VLKQIDTKKFIPIVRANESADKLPGSLGPRKYVDFRIDGDYGRRFEELIRAIHDEPAVSKPALGTSQFSGVPEPDPSSSRVVGPSGLTPGGKSVLDDAWFLGHESVATKGLGKLPGAMELRFALHDPINKSQIELLSAMKGAEIQTFGWPIGIVLDVEDWRPKPVTDGVVAQVAISEKDGFSFKASYDYWALRTNGDFFLLQSLFEDNRGDNEMFADTRIVRVTESLMLCARLYRGLGVAQEAKISIRVSHRGLSGRVLTVASPNRFLTPTKTTESASQSQMVVTLDDLQSRLTDHVMQVVEPLLMLFDFKKLDRKIYDEIVTGFVNGRIV